MNPIGLFTAETAGGISDPSSWITFAMLGGVFILMYFLMIRPQKKKEKEIVEMRKSVIVGDKVTTNGGIVGIVLKDNDETLILLSGSQKIEICRWAVRTIDEKADRDTTEEEK